MLAPYVTPVKRREASTIEMLEYELNGH